MIKKLLFTVFSILSLTAFSQSFEGTITYEMEMMNPNPEMIPDSTWETMMEEQFGKDGKMIQKYYYKNNKYVSEISTPQEKGFQAYNPKDGLLYAWSENSDTALTIDSKKYMDELVEITDGTETAIVMGIKCKSIVVKSAMGEMVLFYNSEYLKMDASNYKGHIYGHWEQILTKTGCLPLKMQQKGYMSKVTQTATDFKEMEIDDEKFTIPSFKEIIVNPMN